MEPHSKISDILIGWYVANKRDLPWRHTKDPYPIWLSEVVLQQTRVAQGLPYFVKFMEYFPRVQLLANASEQTVLRLWQGLGYYSRARSLHKTAQIISHLFDGEFPQSYKELLKLKGIGTYTASAIASFAYNEHVAVLDGNVFRVLARLFGIETDIASNTGKKQFQALADELLPKKNSSTHNQAIMEFGALQCTPKKPNCMVCPLNHLCVAYQLNIQNNLPVKIKKTNIKHRYFYYFWIEYEGKMLLRKRTDNDIWTGLYEPYLVENTEILDDEEVFNLPFLKEVLQNGTIVSMSETAKHVLTHQRIIAKFWHIQSKKPPYLPDGYAFYLTKDIDELPKPILIDKYFKKNDSVAFSF